MRKLVTMREALRRPEYFGDVLAGDSWANWRVLLIAIAGEKLDEAEAVTFKTVSVRPLSRSASSGRWLAAGAENPAPWPSWPPG